MLAVFSATRAYAPCVSQGKRPHARVVGNGVWGGEIVPTKKGGVSRKPGVESSSPRPPVMPPQALAGAGLSRFCSQSPVRAGGVSVVNRALRSRGVGARIGLNARFTTDTPLWVRAANTEIVLKTIPVHSQGHACC